MHIVYIFILTCFILFSLSESNTHNQSIKPYIKQEVEVLVKRKDDKKPFHSTAQLPITVYIDSGGNKLLPDKIESVKSREYVHSKLAEKAKHMQWVAYEQDEHRGPVKVPVISYDNVPKEISLSTLLSP